MKDPIEKWSPVAVTWLDADTDYGSAKSADIAARYDRKCIRRTIGWLIVQDKERIVVAMDDDRENAAGGGEDCQTITTIPTPYVQRLDVLCVKPARRK